MTHPSTAWADRALCREIGSEAFFVDSGQSAAPARRICARCTVAEACLDYALTTMNNATDVGGVYGGTTYTQRHKLRKQQGAA